MKTESQSRTQYKRGLFKTSTDGAKISKVYEFALHVQAMTPYTSTCETFYCYFIASIVNCDSFQQRIVNHILTKCKQLQQVQEKLG